MLAVPDELGHSRSWNVFSWRVSRTRGRLIAWHGKGWGGGRLRSSLFGTQQSMATVKITYLLWQGVKAMKTKTLPSHSGACVRHSFQSSNQFSNFWLILIRFFSSYGNVTNLFCLLAGFKSTYTYVCVYISEYKHIYYTNMCNIYVYAYAYWKKLFLCA